jgi:hypothetical protein
MMAMWICRRPGRRLDGSRLLSQIPFLDPMEELLLPSLSNVEGLPHGENACFCDHRSTVSQNDKVTLKVPREYEWTGEQGLSNKKRADCREPCVIESDPAHRTFDATCNCRCALAVWCGRDTMHFPGHQKTYCTAPLVRNRTIGYCNRDWLATRTRRSNAPALKADDSGVLEIAITGSARKSRAIRYQDVPARSTSLPRLTGRLWSPSCWRAATGDSNRSWTGNSPH